MESKEERGEYRGVVECAIDLLRLLQGLALRRRRRRRVVVVSSDDTHFKAEKVSKKSSAFFVLIKSFIFKGTN